MLLLLISEIGIFIAGGGGLSFSGSYSVQLSTGISVEFEDSTFGFLKVQSQKHFDISLCNYKPKSSESEISFQSNKLMIGAQVEYRINSLLLKPGIYYSILSQKIRDKYISGNYIITDITTSRNEGFVTGFNFVYPLDSWKRIEIYYNKEWITLPENEFGLEFILILN